MESPFELMLKYWNNPTSVLDALDIKAWPPVDEAGDSFYQGQQYRPTTAEAAVRGDIRPSVARPSGTYSADAAGAESQHQQPPRPRRRPWLFPNAYRGQRVRNGVQRVRALEAEVGAVETRIMASLDQILGDLKERAKVNELIMDVLLRLDGVGGDCRKYRKSVIKKAISPQEALNCLVCGDWRGGGGAADSRGDLMQNKQLGYRVEEHQSVTERGKDRGNGAAGGDNRGQGSSCWDDNDEKGSRRTD